MATRLWCVLADCGWRIALAPSCPLLTALGFVYREARDAWVNAERLFALRRASGLHAPLRQLQQERES